MRLTKLSRSVQGKVVVVTGAASGMGKATAELFADEGAHVAAIDLTESALNEVVAAINEAGKSAKAWVLDLADAEAIKTVFDEIAAHFGGIDILVNNAGVLSFGLLEDIKPDEFRRLMEVNVTGTVLGMQAVIPCMKTAGSGAIINTSSASGMMPSNFISAYAASKFAVRGLSRSAALELGPFGIRVNTVHPGGVNTPMTNPMSANQDDVDKGYGFVPLQRGCSAAEIAKGVTYLASNAASYCNGTELVIDGGMTAGVYFPGLPGTPT